MDAPDNTAGPTEAQGSNLARWLAAGAVLLGEYLLISFRFDAGSVSERGGLWALVGSLGAIAPLGVVAATAALLLRTSQKSPVIAEPKARVDLALVGVHVLLFGAFFVLTGVSFGEPEAPPGPAAVWLGLWASAGAGSAITLLLGAIGAHRLKSVLSASLMLGLGVGVAAWLAGLLTTALWAPLTRATFAVVVLLLRPWYPGIVALPDEAVVELGDFAIHVAPVCSGLEGIGLVTVLTIGMLVTFRDEFRFPRALLLIPLGIALVWLGNALRVALLVVVGGTWDPDVALGGFHSKAGWVFFCGIAFALLVPARRIAFFSRKVQDDGLDNPTAAHLMPALAVIATGLVTGMFARTVDSLYWVRVIVAAATLLAFRNYYRGIERKFHVYSVLVGAAVGVVWIVTAPVSTSDGEEIRTFGIVMRVAGSVLIAPLCEELAFRGYALRRFVSADFTTVSYKTWTPLAVLGSSAAFAAVHERWFLAFLTGIVYAIVQIRSGRLADAIVAHAASNVVVCVWVILTGEHWHW